MQPHMPQAVWLLHTVRPMCYSVCTYQGYDPSSEEESKNICPYLGLKAAVIVNIVGLYRMFFIIE